MTTTEYLAIKGKCPDPSSNSSYHTHYDGEQEDFDKIVSYNKELIQKYPWLMPRNRFTDLPVGQKPEDYEETFDEETKKNFVKIVLSKARMVKNGWKTDLECGLSTEEEAIEYLKSNPDEFERLKKEKRDHDEKYYQYDYSYTELDEMPNGWRIAFGDAMCEEIQKELEKFNYVDKYRITQIKEKYGSLRWYDWGSPVGTLSEDYEEIIKDEWGYPPYNRDTEYVHDDGKTDDGKYRFKKYKILDRCRVEEIISKYCSLSYDTCIMCGKPAKWETTGWISPYCDECKTYLESKDFNDRFVPIGGDCDDEQNDCNG